MLIRSLDEYNISAMMLNLNNQKEQASRKVQELKRKRNKLIISAILAFPLLLTMLVHLFNIPLPKYL